MGLEEKLPSGVLLTTVEGVAGYMRKAQLLAGHVRPGLLRDRDDDDRRPEVRPRPLRHGGVPGQPAPGRPDDRGRPGQPEDGPGAAPDLRPDGRPEVGAGDGRVRQQRRHVQQLRDRAGRRPRRPGRHVPPRLPAAPGDADRRDPQAPRPGAAQAKLGANRAAGRSWSTRPPPCTPLPDLADEGPACGEPRQRTRTTREHVPSRANVPAQPGVGARPIGTRHGMFGVRGTGDTSGYGGLVKPIVFPGASQRPYGGWFDEVADALEARLRADRPRRPRSRRSSSTAARSPSTSAASDLPSGRPAAARRRARCASSSAPASAACTTPSDTGRELHAVYHLLSMTHNRRIRLEVSLPRRRPAHPDRSSRSTRPTTGTSARPSTSSASSSTATPR